MIRKEGGIVMNRDLHRRMAAALAILLTTLLALCAPALAVAPTGSLTLTASYGTTPLVGAPFKLYLVAEHDEASDFALCGEFAGSSVDLSDLSTAGKLAQAALDLERWAGEKEIAPLAQQNTDSSGSVSFTSLAQGLYLVGGVTHQQGGHRYQSAPCLISLPSWDGSTGVWELNVTAFPKFERSGTSGGDPTPPPTEPDTPTPTEPDTPTPPDPVEPPDTPPTPPAGPEKLPQTGQLKWPVPVLAALGMLLLLAGSILMRRERDA